MSLTTIILAAAIAQAAPVTVTAPTVSAGMTDVAYSELSEGNANAAVSKLESAAQVSSDPALLINLGTAYARQGATDKALAAFRAAIASPERYELEMSNGTWADSRSIARAALVKLQRQVAQAAR